MRRSGNIYLSCGSHAGRANWMVYPRRIGNSSSHRRDWHETSTHFFVHAGAYHDIDSTSGPKHLVLESFADRGPHGSGNTWFVGHAARSGQPLNLGHAVCIDSSASGDGWLTCLDVNAGCVWQANQKGEPAPPIWMIFSP